MKKNILLFMTIFVCGTVGPAGATPIMIQTQHANTWNMESQQYMAQAFTSGIRSPLNEFDLFVGFPNYPSAFSSTTNRLSDGLAYRSWKEPVSDPASESAMMLLTGIVLIWLAKLWKKYLRGEFGNFQIGSNSSSGFPTFHIVSKETVTDNCYAQFPKTLD
ncbi:MAG: hypothetical protein DRI57_26125 [Deltaproteobacteria bacterium]|nr:MAG: hypothetical protein DRI57_26125 [Deltaproteobacteria bacterium]